MINFLFIAYGDQILGAYNTKSIAYSADAQIVQDFIDSSWAVYLHDGIKA